VWEAATGWVAGGPALSRLTDGPFHVASMQFALHYMFERCAAPSLLLFSFALFR
jgi:hypothetical protein